MTAPREDRRALRDVDGEARSELRIALVRHARSAHVHSGWIDARGFRAWREAYEGAGILDDQAVPVDLASLADSAGVVVSSVKP